MELALLSSRSYLFVSQVNCLSPLYFRFVELGKSEDNELTAPLSTASKDPLCLLPFVDL